MSVFIESFAPPPRMLIFGAVDFTAALARVAKVLGYRVTVCDAREVFATRPRFPMADEVVVDWPDRYLDRGRRRRSGPRDAVCVLTHDPKFDVPAIVARAAAPTVGYLGAMGTRRTHDDAHRAAARGGRRPTPSSARVMAPDRPRHRRPHAGGDGGRRSAPRSSPCRTGRARPSAARRRRPDPR